MSQHSYSIANESGAAFRADVNNALQALASCSRGAAAPGTIYAAQVWDDSTANVQKKRNAANSAWIVKGTLDETFILTRGSNTILGLSDIGKCIVATAGFTQTLTAAATLGDGWYCDFINTHASNSATIDPNGAETINGAATVNVPPGCGGRIFCNGSSFQMVVAPGTDRNGIFSPTVKFGGASTGITYSAQSGNYVLHGTRCDVWITLTLSSKGSATGAASISGLPFTIGGTTVNLAVPIYFVSMTTSYVNLMGVLSSGDLLLQGLTAAAASFSAVSDTNLSATTTLRCQFSFVLN